jgi:hypothetical protein
MLNDDRLAVGSSWLVLGAGFWLVLASTPLQTFSGWLPLCTNFLHPQALRGFSRLDSKYY